VDEPHVVQDETVEPVSTDSTHFEPVAGVERNHRDEPTHDPGGHRPELQEGEDGDDQRQQAGAGDGKTAGPATRG
jgi:hypothetical protein